MVLPLHSSHLIQPLDVEVFGPLKTHIVSAIEPLISMELHHILKAEWLSAYVEAHDKAFTIQNIWAGFHGTGIQLFNQWKVLNQVQPIAQESIVIRGSTPIDVITPFKDSVLTSSSLNTEDACSANAALLNQLTANVVGWEIDRGVKCTTLYWAYSIFTFLLVKTPLCPKRHSNREQNQINKYV